MRQQLETRLGELRGYADTLTSQLAKLVSARDRTQTQLTAIEGAIVELESLLKDDKDAQLAADQEAQ